MEHECPTVENVCQYKMDNVAAGEGAREGGHLRGGSV